MNGNNQKVFLYVPRLHNNMVGLCEHLASNYDLTIIEISPFKFSTIEFEADRLFLNESRISQLIGKIFGYGGSSLPRKFSSFRAIFNQLSTRQKNYVFLRGLPRAATFQMLFFSLICNVRLCIIEQINLESIHPLASKFRVLATIIGLFKHCIITQIKQPNIIHSSNFLTYVPFILPSKWLTCELPRKESFPIHDDFGTISICTIGKYDQKRKNIKELCEAVSSFKNKEFSIHLDVIGHGSYSQFLQFEKDYPSISFHLNRTSDEVRKILKQADLFLLPSVDEPASFSVYESLSCGTPVICTSSNGTSDIVKSTQSGFTLHLDDINTQLKLVDLLQQLPSSTVTYKMWKSSTHNVFIQNYNPYSVFLRYKSLIDDYFE